MGKGYIVLLLAVLVLIGGLVYVITWDDAAKDHQEVAECLESAERFYAAGKYRQAREKYLTTTRLSSSHAHAQLQLAKISLFCEDLEEAEKRALLALQCGGEESEAKAIVADCRLSRQDWESVRKYIAEAAAVDPDLPLVHYVLGKIALLERKLEKARGHLQPLLEDFHLRPHVAVLLAGLHMEKREFSEAEQVLLEVAETTHTPRMGVTLVEIHFLSGNPAKAMAYCREILPTIVEHQKYLERMVILLSQHGKQDQALDIALSNLSRYPNSISLHLVCARVYFQHGLLAQAERHANTALTHASDSRVVAPIRELLAGIYDIRGSSEEAREQLTEIISASPRYLPAYLRKARILRRERKHRQALATYEQAKEVFPNNAAVILGMADCHLRMRQWSKAGTLARKMLELAPDSVEGKAVLAIAQQQLGEGEEAHEIYRQIVEQDSSGIAANNLAFMIAEKGGDLEYAQKLAKTAVKKMRGNSTSLDTLAWVWFKQGKLDEARKLLEKALTVYPKKTALHYHYGLVLLEQQDENAISVFNKVVELEASSPYAREARRWIAEWQQHQK